MTDPTNPHADIVAPRTGSPPGDSGSTSPVMPAGPFLIYGLNLTEQAPRPTTGHTTPRWLPPPSNQPRPKPRPRPKPSGRPRTTRGR